MITSKYKCRVSYPTKISKLDPKLSDFVEIDCRRVLNMNAKGALIETGSAFRRGNRVKLDIIQNGSELTRYGVVNGKRDRRDIEKLGYNLSRPSWLAILRLRGRRTFKYNRSKETFLYGVAFDKAINSGQIKEILRLSVLVRKRGNQQLGRLLRSLFAWTLLSASFYLTNLLVPSTGFFLEGTGWVLQAAGFLSTFCLAYQLVRTDWRNTISHA